MKDIEDVKQLNDNDLADKLAEAMGWRLEEHPAVNGTGQWMAEYDFGVYCKPDETYQERLGWEPCDDLEQAREAQSKAIKVDTDTYIRELASMMDLGYPFNRNTVAKLLQATPRQISEAAYITIQEVKG
ncbi:hypothetical protein J2T12_005082 [Paenibacillus anaericanus]|uniref:hypothetical protein n=1 Tax=Paenibacillus anaericanus TaxID=170367 RepID=UPI0027804744|nr:hypothetical protein [Paenibacillus anaericanus]MDQ0091642.1 hypothetical protein [Paenibacillus anaericanus]